MLFEPAGDLQAEPGLLARVLDNLLDNAARYSEAGSPIEVGLRPAEGGLEITVRDHGIGISSEDQARMFTPFFRADAAARDTRAGSAWASRSPSRSCRPTGGGSTSRARPTRGLR